MDWNASFFHKMISFVLTLIRNCLEAPFLASIRATSLELPQHLFLCCTYLFFQEKGYMCMVLRDFFYTYLIKQCDPLLFMNSFCWEWNKSCLCRERSSRDEKKAKPSFWVFPECFRSVYSKNIDDLVGWREFLEKREAKLKFEISPFHMSKCANYALKIYSTNYYFLWIQLILAPSSNKTYQMLSFLSPDW